MNLQNKNFCFFYKLFFVVVLLIVLLISNTVQAEIPYKSYNYNFYGNVVPSPLPYIPTRIIDGEQLEIEGFKKPGDIYVSQDKLLYILDSGNNRIICLNKNWNLERIINKVTIKGKESYFNNPQGIFLKDGNIYVADTNNNRIVVMKQNGDLITIIDKPESQLFFEKSFTFKPQKIGVDSANRIYVIAEGVYEGLMVFGIDGNFRGYVGAPRVTPNPIDLFWRQFSTREQIEQHSLFLPTKFSNLSIDSLGFVYTTVSNRVNNNLEVVKRLNSAGKDILRRQGVNSIVGDVIFPLNDDSVASITGPSKFVDVAVRKYEIYSVLDQKRGRIFTYNKNGKLLYVFGGPIGDIKGTFSNAVALDSFNNKLLVLDKARGEITIFNPTSYANNIHQAIKHFNQGYLEKSKMVWQKLINQNVNFEFAYTGIGNVFYRENKLKNAMVNFEKGNNRIDYSKVFKSYRRNIIEENFNFIIILFLFISSIIIIAFKFNIFGNIKNKIKVPHAFRVLTNSNHINSDFNINIWSGLKYSFYVIFHPFDGFWELKSENKDNISSASLILLMLVGTYILMRQYTGFIFNYNDLSNINILIEIASVIIPFSLWCSVNWGITTLMEGKGTMRDIIVTSAYSLVPAIIIINPITIISNYLTLQEASFYYMGLSFAIMWTLFLLFISIMVIHEYDLSKTILSCILIIVGGGIIIFFSMLFISILNTLIAFLATIYTEINFRL